MATSKKNNIVNMTPIKGKPGLYTFDSFTRDPKAEKKVVDKIMRKAKTLRPQLLAKNGF
jgi:hypothetical protein